MVLGESLARLLRVSPNDVIELPSPRSDAPTLTVVGTFGSPVAVYTSDVVLANESDARGILDLPPDRATDVAIDLTSPEEAAIVSRAIVAHDGGLRIIDKQVTARTSRVTYGRRAGIVLAASLPALLCMLILAWDRLGGLGPSERREIAVQKAVGWSTADVLYAKLYESVLVAFFACGTGIVIAYAWVFGGSAWGCAPFWPGGVFSTRRCRSPRRSIPPICWAWRRWCSSPSLGSRWHPRGEHRSSTR